jgi:RNA polymerase sigma-70 factor (family 1)
MKDYGKKTWVDEKDLLAKIAGRDENAFRIIFDRYQRRIYTFSLKLLKSNELAEETVQEAFLKLWLMGDSLTKISNLEGYLVMIARNRAIDQIRVNQQQTRLKTVQEESLTDKHNETEEQILLRDARSLIDQTLKLLPQQQRLVYQLCHLEGLKYEEAAERLQISPLTVKSHMQKALRALRQQLGPYMDTAILLLMLSHLR